MAATMIVLLLIMPAGVAISGAALAIWPPKTISGAHGYRTTRSMRSQAAWDYAQVRSGKLMCAVGIIMLPLAAAIALLMQKIMPDIDVAALSTLPLTFVELIPFIVVILKVESELKRKFPK